MQTEADYLGIKDCWGIEVYNHGSIVGGWVESPLPFDTMLKMGKRIFPLAVDDSHSIYSACGGWLMVSADNLEYGEVFNALKKGDFYSSTGPEIKDIYFEDDQLRLTYEGNHSNYKYYASLHTDSIDENEKS